jgi:phage terminase large subunit
MMQDFLHDIETKKDWIWDRLRWLRHDKNLDAEQLFWYWNKYDKYLDKDLIKQEYPCTPQEAFLLSGKNVFDTEIILNRLDRLKKPLKVGYFIYDYDGLKITNIRWVNDRFGYIKLYQMPNTPEITQYCIGGDTAGEGSDYFTGHVLDARTGQQVAVLRQQFDADLYTKQMYCLGKYYKDALIGIEANFDSYPIMELQRLGYPKKYAREVQDSYTHKTEKRFGFKTTSLTRPTIISKLVEIVREHSDTINDQETLTELLTIVKNDKGRIEAPEGGHDDMMMGLAIAHHIRDQVVFINEPIEVRPQYRFNVERYNEVQYDYGETITVV